jgi:hypothetical protein
MCKQDVIWEQSNSVTFLFKVPKKKFGTCTIFNQEWRAKSSGAAQWDWHGFTGHTALSCTEPPGTQPLSTQDVHAPQLGSNEHMAEEICLQWKRNECEYHKMPQIKQGVCGQGTPTSGTSAGESPRTRLCAGNADRASWNLKSNCPAPWWCSPPCKDLASKAACFEKLILLTLIGRYLTEKELEASLILYLNF